MLSNDNVGLKKCFARVKPEAKHPQLECEGFVRKNMKEGNLMEGSKE